jgi:HemY protein
MRLKITLFITKIILLIAAILWFFQNPGVVTIEWQGMEMEISLGVVLLGLLVLFILYGLIGWAFKKIGHFLNWFYEGKETRRRREGRALLAEAFTAQILDCENRAISLAQDAQKVLPLSGIPSVILYQIGKKLENQSLIDASLKTLNKTDELKPIVIAEELSRCCQKENYPAAEKVIQSLKKDFSKSPWAWREIAKYKYKVQDWQAAHEALYKAESLGGFQENEFNEMASVIWYELSQQPAKNRLDSLQLLEKAYETDPSNSVAAVAYAKFLQKEGDEKAAINILKNSWAIKPDWHVAETYAQILSKNTSDIEHLKYIKQIVETNKNHPAAILMLAIGCIKSKVWGEATKYVQKIPDGVDKKILQAALIKAEKNDFNAANQLIKEVLSTKGHPQAASAL